MRNLVSYLPHKALLPILVVITWACQDSQNQIAPRNPEILSLNYDSDNVSAPTLDQGNYEGAARFSADQISQLDGAELIEVNYFIALLPDRCLVNIYGGNSPTTPGALLYSVDVTSDMQPASWNTHQLTMPVILSNEDIWVSIAFEIATPRPTLGCDAGPAFDDGDWLYSDNDNQWLPLSQRTPIDINWNVRAVVNPG